MAINFNQNTGWTLTPINVDSVRNDVKGLLIDGEIISAAFKTARDQLVFTNKRIISIDVQGITGRKKSFSSMPYSNIQYFAIQTVGFMELVPDSELFLMFTNGFTAKFEFKGNVDIGEIGRMISEYVLSE
ncbi:MAG: PH domain-containing protein [Ruminococcus sp.]|nr:PH domain-containing protein [Ruminococcus sp.]